jgi:hypothetical protein
VWCLRNDATARIGWVSDSTGEIWSLSSMQRVRVGRVGKRSAIGDCRGTTHSKVESGLKTAQQPST